MLVGNNDVHVFIWLPHLATTCTEAGKNPGCCTGGLQACSVTANGKTCFCDNDCITNNDCCSDVPKMCGMQIILLFTCMYAFKFYAHFSCTFNGK